MTTISTLERPRPSLSIPTWNRYDDLQARRGYPLVSVLMSTTPGRPITPAERARLDALVQRARERVALEFDAAMTDAVIAPLEALVESAAASPAADGLALFSGAGYVHGFRLSSPVDNRVVVDETFATRDIVRLLTRQPPCRVLVLGGGTARLFVTTGPFIHEVQDDRFPIVSSETETVDDDRRGHLHQAERTHRRTSRWDGFLRQVDHALNADPSTRALPLVIAATEPMTSRFRLLTDADVVGVLPGNYLRSRPSRLRHAATSIIDLHLARLALDDLGELARAERHRHALYDINEIWRASLDRSVRLLLVGNEFRFPATVDDTGRSLVPSADAEAPGVIDDAVDEIIEAVLRAGGRVRFVPDDNLPSGIAAVANAK